MNYLAALKGFESLNHRVTIYIPATINVNQTIDNSAYVDKAATILSQAFGGATTGQVKGYWVSDSINALVKEDTTKVYANCTEDALNNNIETVIQYCHTLQQELSQDCIGLEVDNAMYFIE